jgi:hypothetical protein
LPAGSRPPAIGPQKRPTGAFPVGPLGALSGRGHRDRWHPYRPAALAAAFVTNGTRAMVHSDVILPRAFAVAHRTKGQGAALAVRA